MVAVRQQWATFYLGAAVTVGEEPETAGASSGGPRGEVILVEGLVEDGGVVDGAAVRQVHPGAAEEADAGHHKAGA